MMYGELAEQNASYQTGHNTGSLRACGYMQNRFDEIVRENPRESIGKSALLFPFFYAFFWSAYYDCQKKTNGKQKIFSCKKSVCEVSENTKNSGNRE